MTGKKAAKMLGQIYKGYIYKNLLKDVLEFAKDRIDDMDIDKKALLKRVGVKPIEPGKTFFGAFSLLLIGAGVGAIAGVLLAPRPGAETLQEVKERAMGLVQQGQQMQEPARA